LGVGTSHGHFGLLDSPRPGLGGSHHLPPYSILCSSPPKLHPNGLFSQDSQVGVSKLSRVRVPGLWTTISLRPKLGSGRVLNQSCSSRPELSNVVSHSLRRHREEVDSWLLVVRSQTTSLIPGPSFAHNLGYRCLNDQCEAIFDIYVLIPFQWHQEHPNVRCFGPCCRTLNIRESRRTPNPQLWECWVSPAHFAKVGLRQYTLSSIATFGSYSLPSIFFYMLWTLNTYSKILIFAYVSMISTFVVFIY